MSKFLVSGLGAGSMKRFHLQAQQVRSTTQAITQTQSLAAVKTLLHAGLGAITYLRNLLPEDNFTYCYLTSADDSFVAGPAGEGSSQDLSQESVSSRRTGKSSRIMTMARGYTDEADRILNYMEYGIFEALEKKYLRSFIFAVYLV
ncbi:HORMA domain-containing protein [Crassisporium funariophilum]|nr:HORMA domain-containing protein [Crassisporium funariophilum]